MATKYGMAAKVYRNTATYGSPTWTELTLVRDGNLTSARREADISTRGSAFGITAGTMIDKTFEFDMNWDPADTGFQALLDAHNNATPGTTIELLIADGPSGTAGTEGLRAHMSVVKFDRGEPLDGAQVASVAVKPGPYPSGEGPSWFVAS